MPTVTPGAITPAVPYPQPVPPPTGLGVSRVSVSIDAAWLPYVIGCCKVLTANSTFDPPDPAPALAAIMSAYDLLKDLSTPTPVAPSVQTGDSCSDCSDCGDCMQLRYNCGTLQIWDCVQQVWVNVPTTGSCAENPAPGAGATQPPAGGSSGNECLNVDASTFTPLPWNVNTGDTLDFTSVLGAANDGTSLDYYCEDGSIFFLGACAGGGSPSSGDPLNTSNHMHLLLKIGTNYYPLTVGIFTVPSGVTNQSVYIQANTPTVANARGKYTVCVTYANNATATWRAHIDFTTNSGGFVNNPFFSPGQGVWTPGTGWVGSVGVGSGPVYSHGVYIKLPLTSANITGASIKGSKTDGSSINPANVCFEFQDQAATQMIPNQTFGSMPSSPFNMSGPGASGTTEIDILLWDYEFTAPGGYGTTTITDLYLSGLGTIPPELAAFAY